ncbi:MAG TPA: hypothetical protein VM534_11580 [Thermoanaerobaculia bacterium]|nr:hypothetical protein [Thermoanaerobaculia bacterium]
MTKHLSLDTVTDVSAFEDRRRLRRFRVIVYLTRSLLQRNPSLTHREARCLVECARKSIIEMSPVHAHEFDRVILPQLETIIRDRWPIEEFLSPSSSDLIN